MFLNSYECHLLIKAEQNQLHPTTLNDYKRLRYFKFIHLFCWVKQNFVHNQDVKNIFSRSKFIIKPNLEDTILFSNFKYLWSKIAHEVDGNFTSVNQIFILVFAKILGLGKNQEYFLFMKDNLKEIKDLIICTIESLNF